MATKDDGSTQDDTEDSVLDAATKEKVAQADARKKIAEADLAAATAKLPKLPSAFPTTEVDASDMDASFAVVNCYRAALDCIKAIVNEVGSHLTMNDPVI